MDTKLKDRLDQIGKWMREDSRLWDVLTCMRGPDRGLGQEWSERPCDSGSEASTRYPARVQRKMDTVAVLRATAFGSCPGARTRTSTYVTLPPRDQWDHFDKHVARAAGPLGLEVRELRRG